MIEATFRVNEDWEIDDVCHIYPHGAKIFFIKSLPCSATKMLAVVISEDENTRICTMIENLEHFAEDATPGIYRGLP